MNRFTIEETNLISIYNEGGKVQLIANLTSALPFMEADMKVLAERTIQKIEALTEADYAGLSIFAADEA